MAAAFPANPSPPVVLTFAASDPTCGAGLQADILTLASLGCHPLSVVTAITVQDTAGVEGVLPIDAEWVADQARALLEDMPVAAFKLGMMGSVEVIAAIAEVISDYPDIPVVLDPVLASGRGDQFADEEMIEAMIGSDSQISRTSSAPIRFFSIRLRNEVVVTAASPTLPALTVMIDAVWLSEKSVCLKSFSGLIPSVSR